jgi:hypothetical protein
MKGKEQLDAALKAMIDSGVKPRGLDGTLFNLAKSYHEVAELALAQISKTKNADFAAPALMCRSFAIELLLKYFIAVDHPGKKKTDLDAIGVDLHGHKYSVLFDRIGETHKLAIAKKYSELSKNQSTPADFRKALLDLGDDPFVGWRYVYEATETKYFSLELLVTVVQSLGLAAQDVRQAGATTA